MKKVALNMKIIYLCNVFQTNKFENPQSEGLRI